MKYCHATLVVTNAVAVNLRKLSQMLDRGDCDGMFLTPLSASGALPATHFISSGAVPIIYFTALGDATKLETAARTAYAEENETFPYTTEQIENALSKCTISTGTFTSTINGVTAARPESPHALLTRLGLKMIQGAI